MATVGSPSPTPGGNRHGINGPVGYTKEGKNKRE